MEYLSNFSSEAEYLANYSKLKFPNISVIDDGIDTTVVFEKESHIKIDVKNTEIKHNKSKYSVGDLFIYDKSHQAFGVYSFEEIKAAQAEYDKLTDDVSRGKFLVSKDYKYAKDADAKVKITGVDPYKYDTLSIYTPFPKSLTSISQASLFKS